MKSLTRKLPAFQIILLSVVALAANGRGVPTKPSVLFVMADQWRAAAFGYAGDPNVKTPHLDRLASQSVNFANAIAAMPVCCPTRASLLTGQRPLTHGVFLNDVELKPEAVTIAEILGASGYNTGYVGKWHLNARGRSSFIPRERRQGFDYWKVLECTHAYNNSFYYADGPEKLKWDGYDAIAQTKDVQQYLRDPARSAKPFFFVLAWGPPHNPYHTAPKKYRDLYDPAKIQLRPNVPENLRADAQKNLAGYYAHCTALDECVNELLVTLKETGVATNTILIFTSDHGDLLGSHGGYDKQRPNDEASRIPLLMHFPPAFGITSRKLDAPINSEDLMPTILSLCCAPIPASVEGLDYSGHIRGGKSPSDGATLLSCASPFGNWSRKDGGREYRGVRTARHTYVRDLAGPWLLFDNETDPYQMTNLVGRAESGGLQGQLDAALKRKLAGSRDEFLPGEKYIERWGYTVNANGTVPYDP